MRLDAISTAARGGRNPNKLITKTKFGSNVEGKYRWTRKAELVIKLYHRMERRARRGAVIKRKS